jgi:replication-associated recombination protein RarA
MSKPISLFERYRPKSLSEVVGQGPAVKALELIRSRNGTLGGQAYFLAGKPGSGKTTLAQIIAHEVAGHSIGIVEMDAGKADVAFLDWAMKCYRYRPIGASGHAFILNEVHGWTKPQIRRVLEVTEPPGGLPEYVVWIFTTTAAGEKSLFGDDDLVAKTDASAFSSRCKVLPFVTNARDLVGPFAEYARKIAQLENLDGQPISAYVNLFYKHDGNLRRMLQDIEQGVMLA